MYYFPEDYNLNSYRETKENSYIRLFNASPNVVSADVYIGNTLIIKNLIYKQYTDYIPLQPGNYHFKIYASDNASSPIIDTEVFLPEFSVFNLSIIGIYPQVNLYPIPEPAFPQNFGRSCIRFINLAPASPPVNVSMTNGTAVFTNVAYTYITDYACVPGGTYNFNITSSSTNNILAVLSNAQLQSNNFYTIYLVGLLDGTPPLEAMLVPEPR